MTASETRGRRRDGELADQGHWSPSALARNVAIWPRVSGASGQNFPEPQPPVTPDFARASTNGKKGWLVGTSLKVAPAGRD